jgi:caffeoyl-CoA O-methyltransferase
MVDSVARVATDQPGRYVKQIVSHLAHKRTTWLADDGSGVVDFGSGRCTLTAQAGVLLLAATAPDRAELDHVRDVLGRHLERFGGREGLRVTWSEPA